jgi:hypothetical protein
LATSVSIADRPEAPDFVRFPGDAKPRFLITIDCEEEFDWNAPLRREGHGTATIAALARFQRSCQDSGVVPTFLLDYPVANAPATADALGPAIAAGRAEIGVHLHPWVTPPFEEDVSEFNSFAGNLPEWLECAKFRATRDSIVEKLGVMPQIYRAGRHGVGPHSARILGEAGIAIDSSVRPLFDYSATGGPDFHDHPQRPYWLDRTRGLIELPLTTVFNGRLRRAGRKLYRPLQRLPHARGVFARTGLLERVPLTPEGVTAREAIGAIDAALAQQLPVLVFSFHSPSLLPGHTPYVRDAKDADAFHAWWQQILAHLARRGIEPTTVRELTDTLALASRQTAG